MLYHFTKQKKISKQNSRNMNIALLRTIMKIGYKHTYTTYISAVSTHHSNSQILTD